MESFRTYYSTQFRQDLTRFVASIPDKSKFHDDPNRQSIITIQYGKLSAASRHLDFLTKDDREYFGVALFFTILADMVFYTHYRSHYFKFRDLTLYPKFIGDCPGACPYHNEPAEVFTAMNKGQLSEARLKFIDKFTEAIEIMHIEVTDFFRDYMPEIDGEEFWEKCKKEFPPLILL